MRRNDCEGALGSLILKKEMMQSPAFWSLSYHWYGGFLWNADKQSDVRQSSIIAHPRRLEIISGFLSVGASIAITKISPRELAKWLVLPLLHT